jgi:hypothetical protein
VKEILLLKTSIDWRWEALSIFTLNKAIILKSEPEEIGETSMISLFAKKEIH